MPKKSISCQQKLKFLNLIQTSTSVNMIHYNKRKRQNKYEIHEDPLKKIHEDDPNFNISDFMNCNFPGKKEIDNYEKSIQLLRNITLIKYQLLINTSHQS
ncbi:unnamed protein product [Prunus brigantina]